MNPAVFLPAGLIRFGALRTFLAVADGLQLVPVYAELDEEFFGSLRATVGKTEVVFGRAALVCVAFDHNRGVRIIVEQALKDIGVASQRRTRIFADRALVVVKERVLDIGRENITDAALH